MKRMALLLGILLFLFVGGCSYVVTRVPVPRLRVYSNIPWYTTTVAVVNSTPHLLEVFRDGKLIATNIGTGEDVVVGFYNLSGSSAQASIIVKAWSREGEFVGATSRSFYISGYQRESLTWIITPRDFQRW